jgi:imidazole glycerol-phosphate synthase subunit HisH
LTVVRFGIIDYGMGNIRSVVGAVEKIGHSAVVSSDGETLGACDKLILPGVGAFADAMANIAARDLGATLHRLVVEVQKPILGICLGAQLLARTSAEFGPTDGLGWIDASVDRIPDAPETRVPHVGWNRIQVKRTSALLDGIPPEALFYFVHSYRILCRDAQELVAGCDHGGAFAAVVSKGNVHGTQFHPEKSQRHGLRLLANFAEKM